MDLFSNGSLLWGASLITLSLVLFLIESQMPGLGVAGVAGAVIFVAGVWALGGGLILIGTATAAALLSVAFTFWSVLESRKSDDYERPGDPKRLVGRRCEVTSGLIPRGSVIVGGERWTAVSDTGEGVPIGKSVKVVRIDGLVLVVSPCE